MTMRNVTAIIAAVFLSVLPVCAQEEGAEEPGSVSEGLDLLQEGTRMLLEGLMQEIGPTLKELEGKIDDLSAYHPPEVLQNGDIIIRRKIPLVPETEGEIDL